jgi:hypothetical protein
MWTAKNASYALSRRGRMARGSMAPMASVAITPVRHGVSPHRWASRLPSSHVYAAECAMAWAVATRATHLCHRVHEANVSGGEWVRTIRPARQEEEEVVAPR